MNAKLKLLSAIILITTFACKVERKKIIESGDLKVEVAHFTDPVNKIAMDYPADWLIEKGSGEMIFTAKEKTTDTTIVKMSVIVSKIIEIKDSVELSQIAALNVNQIVSSNPSFKVIDKKEMLVNNNKAYKAALGLSNINGSIVAVIYFVRNTNTAYTIAFNCYSTTYVKYDKIFDQLAESFTSAN